MASRAVTPLEVYYEEADRIIWAITFWLLFASLLLTFLISRPLEAFTSLATLCLLLVVAEFTVRFDFRDVTTTGDAASYFARRWKKTVHKNSWGFRERELNLKKPHGFYRIAVIGDSITYGQGIEAEQRFTNLLEKQLNAQDRKNKYEVLNFGRPGSETIDHLEILNNSVLKIDSDFILLQWYTNDVEGHDKNKRPAPFRLIPSDFLLSWLHKNSALFDLANIEWITIQERLGWLKSYDDYMIERFGNPGGASSLAAKESLQEFIDTCKEQGLSLGIVLFSDSYHSRSEKLDFLTERALELCKREAILCLDLRHIFAKYKPDWANRLDSHPGPSASRLVAAGLIQTFGALWSR